MSTIKEFNQDTIIPALFSVNVFLPLFNMISAFLLDGGRVLRALLAMKLDRSLATIAKTIGQAFAIFMVLMRRQKNIVGYLAITTGKTNLI